MNYGRAMKVVLAAREMSQQDLATRMKVDRAFISRISTAKNPPSGRTLERIAAGLKIPVYLLVLLASEDADLVGMSKGEADAIGQQLLQLIQNTESANSKLAPDKARKRVRRIADK